jgi:rhodanese-related sulfurtransferase
MDQQKEAGGQAGSSPGAHKVHGARFLALVEAARGSVREIPVEELKALPGAQLIDVREDHEWAAGHPAGAKHLGRGIIERDIEAVFPDVEQPLVLLCGGGFRSVLSAASLQEMGYKQVYSLIGGWRAYQAAGLPVEAP